MTGASNYRSTSDFAEWMAANQRIGISGLDTRALTKLVRREGPPTVVIAHSANGKFDLKALLGSGKKDKEKSKIGAKSKAQAAG